MNLIEPLESRIAPATLLNPTIVTYQDVDGDNVTVKFSKPLLVAAEVSNVFHWNTGGIGTTPDNSAKQQLQTIDLNAITAHAGISGVSITVTAKKDPVHGGNGAADVGFIKATGIDLGTVTVHGDFGHLIAGSGSATKPAVVSLAVDSMIGFGIQEAANASFQTVITGKLGSLKVKRGMLYGSVSATMEIGSVSIGGTLGYSPVDPSPGPNMARIFSGGAIGSVTIGGSVSGTADYSAFIESNGPMGRVKIGRHLGGGSGIYSGAILSHSTLAGVSIGVDLFGRGGANSGSVESAGSMGPISIGRRIVGGDGPESGFIHSGGKLTSVTVGVAGMVGTPRGLLGGGGAESGKIRSDSSMGNVTIHGSLQGGSGDYSGLIQSNGAMGWVKIDLDIAGAGGISSGGIYTPGKLAGVSVGGSLIGGTNISSGSIQAVGAIGAVKIGKDVTGTVASSTGYIQGDSIKIVTIGGSLNATTGPLGLLKHTGSVAAVHALGKVTIKGSVVGSGPQGDPVVISAGGAIKPTATKNLAIAGLTIDGDFTHARILAGYDLGLGAVNADAGIGAILVKGNWTAGSVVAGVKDTTGDGFGRNDAPISGDTTPALLANIASITIKGTAIGSVTPTTDHFGLTAQKVGKVRIHGVTVVLTGTNTLLDTANNDFRLVTL